MDLRGKKVVIVGAGASGLAAASLAVRHGAHVRVQDRRPLGELTAAREALATLGAEFDAGRSALDRLEAADLVVVSPGVPPSAALDAAEAAGVEVIGEVELALRFSTAQIVAITGTNGKSTVTTLVGAMLRASGRRVFVGGNLGTPLSASLELDPAPEWLVVELSSFQLERLPSLSADVAVLLNVSADHLDRYPSFEAYAAAKARIFLGQSPEAAAVIPAGDDLVGSLAEAGPARRHRFGVGGEVRLEGGAIVDRETGLTFPLERLKLAGAHNVDNACAAALAARLAGASVEGITEALASTEGLPHRAELVRELDGVRYVDDSKATNVGATVAALDGLASPERRVVWIGGGVDKGGSYAELRDRLFSVGRAAVLIGRAAPDIARALEGGPLPIERCESLEEAVARARALAQPGDIVLLAPACSSFDMFRSYAERGDVFQAAVRALPAGEGT